MFSYFNLRRPSEFSKPDATGGSNSSGQVTPNLSSHAPSPSPLTIQQQQQQQQYPSRPQSFSENQLASRPASGNFSVPTGGDSTFVGFAASAVAAGLLPNVGGDGGLAGGDNNVSNSGGGGAGGGLAGIRSVLFQNNNNNQNKGRIIRIFMNHRKLRFYHVINLCKHQAMKIMFIKY